MKIFTNMVLIMVAGCAVGCEREPSTSPPATNGTPRTDPSASSPSSTGTAPTRTPPASDADNTRNNEGDEVSTTPLDQSEDPADIKVTADIRRLLMGDAALSTNAKNCKVITQAGGRVTLRGVVDSQIEKDAVEAHAKAVAGVASVDNQLEVKS